MSSREGHPEAHITRRHPQYGKPVLPAIRNVKGFIADGKDTDRLLQYSGSNPAERYA